MSNDLIKRGEVEDILCNAYDGTIDEGALAYLISELKKIPAVPHEMTAREYIITEERCKSWCLSNGGCESCCYHEFCWADAIEPEEYLRFYTLWAKEHPEERSEKNG